MKTINRIFYFFFFLICFVSCGEYEFDKANAFLQPIDINYIKGEVGGDEYGLTQSDLAGLKLQIPLQTNGVKGGHIVVEGNT